MQPRECSLECRGQRVQCTATRSPDVQNKLFLDVRGRVLSVYPSVVCLSIPRRNARESWVFSSGRRAYLDLITPFRPVSKYCTDRVGSKLQSAEKETKKKALNIRHQPQGRRRDIIYRVIIKSTQLEHVFDLSANDNNKLILCLFSFFSMSVPWTQYWASTRPTNKNLWVCWSYNWLDAPAYPWAHPSPSNTCHALFTKHPCDYVVILGAWVALTRSRRQDAWDAGKKLLKAGAKAAEPGTMCCIAIRPKPSSKIKWASGRAVTDFAGCPSPSFPGPVRILRTVYFSIYWVDFRVRFRCDLLDFLFDYIWKTSNLNRVWMAWLLQHCKIHVLQNPPCFWYMRCRCMQA